MIGLVDADSSIPKLAVMRLAAYFRARVLELLAELGSPALVAQRLGVSVRRVREIAQEARRG